MSDLRQWLAGFGLERFAESFEREEVTLDSLPDLTDAELKDLGLPLGPRKLILRAASELRATHHASAPASHSRVHDQDKAGPPSAEAQAERRQLTVMFCDLVGSTALSQELDPEALRELMRGYQQACGAVIQKYDGHVAQYLGDGLMVYFGWPRAHEDDAERAVRAALEMVGTVKAVAAPEPLRVRIGIATGPVVVGGSGESDASLPKVAVGETPNLAARLQSLATPDDIVIAASSYRLLGGAFDCLDLGRHALKGIVEPVPVWRVLGPSLVEGRFDASHGDNLTPLVGREEELGVLMRRWKQATTGEGQIVLMGGEPGIGKSRITRALRERLENERHVRLRYQCSPFHTQSSLHPVIDQFERAAGFTRDDDVQRKVEKIETVLGTAMPLNRVATDAPLFAAMLSLPADAYPPLMLTPQKQKERTLQALIDQIEFLSSHRPVLMVFEDLHWVDPTTEEVLDLLVRRIARLPVLLVVTHRPEYSPRWTGEPHVTSMNLSRLNRRFGAELTENITGGVTLPAGVLDEILAKTDGVPLFVEELTKAVVESGLLVLGPGGYELAGPLTALAIPSTLQDSLMSRLDRLSEVREVAQIGAAIGREFSHELLLAVSQMREPALRTALDQLATADLISRRGTPPDATYAFKHALVQDAAYSSLLHARRLTLHRRIAETLVSRFPERATTEPEVVAHHFDAAAISAQAVDSWLQAGQRAIEHFANVEAIGHFRSGLASLNLLPAGIDRDRRELLLQAGLGTALGTSQGYTPPEVARAFERAYALSQIVGEVPQKFMILFGLWVSFLMRADYPTSWKLARQLLEMSKTASAPGAQVVAHQCMSGSALFTGDLDLALEHAQTGIAHYRESGCPPLGPAYGFDPGILCFEWNAWALLMKGYLDQAVAVWSEGSRLAIEQAHPLTVATNKVHSAGFENLRDDPEATRVRAADAAAYCAEHGILLRQVESGILEGWAQAKTGDIAGGIRKTESALVIWRQLGARIWDSGWYLYLAQAHLLEGDTQKCRSALTEALDAAHNHGEHPCTAELYRFEAELCLAEGTTTAVAEALLRKALDRARDQNAKLWELRAATALAKLWRAEGKTNDASSLLQPVYNWFTEGFDTKDLKEAKALLDELAS